MKYRILSIIGLLFSLNTMAQTPEKIVEDTLHLSYLPEITLIGKGSKSDYQQMPEIVSTNIYAGKKSALIVLDNVQGNVVTNTMRQVLAKIPGIHIWESDPSGIQIGIAARGLSPNRSWEFNVRQNGYDIAADPFGYPEAYYNPPLQAVQRIEVVRGQGALQYGAQFGGLVNYILRNGSEINLPTGQAGKKFEFETQQTIGSNSLFNTYNAIGGETEKLNYYGFFDHRDGNGWRQNGKYYTNAGFGTVTYKFTPKLSVTAELMRSHIRSQQGGGLTDSLFKVDAQQSYRSRNWFDITWTNPAITATYQFSDKARITTKLFATIGDRNSIGFLPSGGITVKDTINLATGTYNQRSLNIDMYRNFGLESRAITDYKIGRTTHTISGGIRLYTGTTHRLADPNNKPTGSTGTGYELVQTGSYLRDINFKSKNAAIFVENIFHLTEKLLVIPGIRYEWLEGSANGKDFVSNAPVILQNITRGRTFLLAGIGAEYHLTKGTEIYANFSQAYRPIQFANLQAPPTNNVIDPELKDAKGYNIDLGYRGKVKNYLQFDVSGYYLQYNNRIGNLNVNGATVVTNVGNSTSKGFEGYAELNVIKALTKLKNTDVIIFGSYSLTDAEYSADHKDAATKGKKVENAPKNIFRGGLSAGYKSVLVSAQLSYVGETFSDANNTRTPTPNGQNGLIPSYTVTDLTASYKFGKLNFKAGLNNIFDERYFTRRAGGYPGPGVLPGDGRNFFVSVGAKL